MGVADSVSTDRRSECSPSVAAQMPPLRVRRADASAQLHAACLIASRHDPLDGNAGYTTSEYESVRCAVASFVGTCKADELPPERTLILLKAAVNDSLRTLRREPYEEVLRAIIFEAFLRSYYGSESVQEA